MHHGTAQLIVRNNQHVRANACRAVQAQFFQLLGVRRFLHVNLNVVLFFKVGDRILYAGRLLDVFPDVKLRGGVDLHRERREDKRSENVLFHVQPHVKV